MFVKSSSLQRGTYPHAVSRNILAGTHVDLLLQTHATQGYDPLLEDKNGRSLTFPPGYERTKRGPTTNFVGNHMTQVPEFGAICLGAHSWHHCCGWYWQCTLQYSDASKASKSYNTSKPTRLGTLHLVQGAIDLVQMELQPVKPQLKMIELHPQAQEGPPKPHFSADLRVEAPIFVPVQRYKWQDKGTHVQLQITSVHHLAGLPSNSASIPRLHLPECHNADEAA